MEKKLEVRNLKISFRTQYGILHAVRGIDFDLYKGETLAIVGESGSGKSVTNRAVMGILAGNGMIDSGEIIYDGQDLVQISEEKFHKIRGDKIAMIFQDPLSSLNPIMRIGKQLTEAMLLKNAASRKNAKNLFNTKLALLNQYMDKASGDDANAIARNKEMCQTFDNFCINSTKLEGEYNNVHTEAEELLLDVNNLIFMIEKKQNIDAKKEIKDFIKRLPKTQHARIVNDESLVSSLVSSLTNDLGKISKNNIDSSVVDDLKKVSNLLTEATNKEKPNFFCLGYYMLKNPDANLDKMPIDEMNTMVREYLDENFMNEFIGYGSQAIKASQMESINKKQDLIIELKEAMEYFKNGDIDEKICEEYIKKFEKPSEDCIDRLVVEKNSTEYTFMSSFTKNVKKYFDGIRHNTVDEKRYQKELAKFNKAKEKGKDTDWTVIPVSYFDTDEGRDNIVNVFDNMIESLQKDIDTKDQLNTENEVIKLIDYLKEQASNLVYKVTKKMAKAKALKLMEEVGIPEPEIRYNQYPFEFSGGMRQRIVIAIALAANPDILICDEPTTALDVTIQAQILELINKLKKERNLSIIFITHNLGVVANMADRIAVMYAGKLVEVGTSDEVFYHPAHPYTWALLSSMPDLDTKDKLEAIPGTPPNMINPPKGDAFAARNKYALEIDFEEEPPMFPITETHSAATWLLHPDAPKIDPPKIVTDRIQKMLEREAARNGK